MKEQDGKIAYCKVRTKEEIEADRKERIENGEEPRNYDDVGLEVWATRDPDIVDAAFRDSLAKVRAIEAAEKTASEKAKRDGMEKAEELED
ncbi:hypothetical protein J4E83_000798 [Alternaria metachromatica]|uniref:uncharacterized protein n=1 Tax=Alternaria metachromatica TaxID=283354 RepID=UPI0020C2264D|nr:uncharacterized protein J4E83_000798 [Alternaria metachromatica]KAI4637977.1 hypothetical protein J4E83_000798 [Alternaria metachromatica]